MKVAKNCVSAFVGTVLLLLVVKSRLLKNYILATGGTGGTYPYGGAIATFGT